MTEQRLRARWLKEDEDARDAAFRALIQHKHGRKALWWLLQIGNIGRQPFSNNALQTAFACGELNVGQQILDRITSVSPEGYVEMMKEMADERTVRDLELTNSRTKRDDHNDGGDASDDDDDNGNAADN